jgi:hypothetical protein
MRTGRCVFGRRFLDVLAQDRPRAFSTVLEGDAFLTAGPGREEPRDQDLDPHVHARPELPTRERARRLDAGPERRYRKLQRLEGDPGREGELTKVVAGLIARVELALDEAGVEYQSALSHLDD